MDEPIPAAGGRAGAGIAPMILGERSGVITLSKPSGLPTQAPPGIDSLEVWVRGRLPPGAYLGVPHRLDRAVSGVILMATTPRAARQLSRQFERRQVGKTYVAIVAADAVGTFVEGEAVVWRDQVAKCPDQAMARIASADDPTGREAVTSVRLLGTIAPQRHLIQLEPHTGRMHQLRLQAATRGMPVVGDALYGGPPLAGVEESGMAGREKPIALHARSIRFRDPEGGEEVIASAPLPPHWPAASRRFLA